MSLKAQLQELENDYASAEAAASGDFEVLPVGTYIVEIKDNAMITSKNKGTPGLSMSFKVVEGAYRNRLIWTTFWITKETLPYFKSKMQKLQVVFSRLSDLEKIKIRGVFEVYVIVEEYNGEPKNTVMSINKKIENYYDNGNGSTNGNGGKPLF